MTKTKTHLVDQVIERINQIYDKSSADWFSTQECEHTVGIDTDDSNWVEVHTQPNGSVRIQNIFYNLDHTVTSVDQVDQLTLVK